MTSAMELQAVAARSVAYINDESLPVKQTTANVRFQTYKNLLVIAVAFLLLFTAYDGMRNLQSSLNTHKNVGVNSLSIYHGFFIISSICLSHPLVAFFGYKWALVLSQVPHLLFMVANYFARASLMYPTAVLVGLGSAPLWTAALSYITDSGVTYAQVTQANAANTISLFMGIFYMFDQSGQIWGNLISFLILAPLPEMPINSTSPILVSYYDKCGADFSEKEFKRIEPTNRVDRTTVEIVFIAYMGACVCSILIVVLFLDQRRTEARDQLSTTFRQSIRLFVTSVKHLANLDQLLLIPITVWLGLQQSFLAAQFTKAFITCPRSPKSIGLVMIFFGIFNSLGSLAVGQAVKVAGRWPFFIAAAILDYALIITMLVWRPTEDSIVVLCALVGLWGLAGAVWVTQIPVLYGVLFPQNSEAAFSNFCLWETTGLLICYVAMPYLRVYIPLLILVTFLSLGMFGYGFIEYRCRSKQPARETPSPLIEDDIRPILSSFRR